MLKRILPGGDVIIEAFRTYPARSVVIVALMLLAGLAEGLGVAAILPTLSVTLGDGSANQTQLGQMVHGLLTGLGIPTDLGPLLTVVVIGLALKAGLTLLAKKHIGYASVLISTDLRLALIRALMRARWAYFTSQPIGALANAMSTEATHGGTTFTGAYNIVATSIQVAVYLGLALLVSWQVTVAAIGVGLLLIVAMSGLVEMTRRASVHASAAYNHLLRQLTDSLSGIKPLKAMGAENRVVPLLEREAHAIRIARQRIVLAKESLDGLREPIIAVFLAFGLYLALSAWGLPFETVLVMAIFFHRTVNSTSRLQSSMQQLAVTSAYYYALRDKIETAVRAEEQFTGNDAPTMSRELRLDAVSFAFGDTQVLRGASLTVPAGRIVTLFGPSGAGKTTLLDLVIGFYRPDDGEVLIDDTPLVDIDMASWRKEIGYVPQEMFLFHDTVLANVTLGDPRFGRADAEAALRAAEAWEFIATLPDGVDTMVGERGSKFSGGQRQRIAIARALVRKPKLLVLDEPTTALDPESEAAICETLRRLSGSVTIFAISHQPALVDIADIVYSVANGIITEVSEDRPAVRGAR